MPSFHLFITFGLDAHHFLIRLTQTLVFLSNLFSFFQSWSNYSPHYSWEWQNTHTHTHLITLISNLKNLGMVFLHWHNKVIYPNHCPNFSLFAFLFSFSLGSKHIKEFSVSWKDPSLYFDLKADVSQDSADSWIISFMIKHSWVLDVYCARQCIFPAFTA